MKEVVVTASTLTGSRSVTLDQVISLELLFSLDSPAGSMKGVFAADAFPEKLESVEVRRGHRVLFEGRVDRQIFRLSGAGRTLSLEARTAGALLLDNEAVPCMLANARMDTVFRLFAKPYGFSLYNPGSQGLLPGYVVRKGISEWEALTGYTRRALGVAPYVVDGQIMVDRPRSATALELGGEGWALCGLEARYTPYGIVSKVVLQGGDGAYNLAVTNPDAAYHKVRRKRYAIPSTEFTDQARLDANHQIRGSMREVEQVQAQAPGFVPAQIGQEARVLEGAIAFHNLLVRELRYSLDPRGLVTSLALADSVYY